MCLVLTILSSIGEGTKVTSILARGALVIVHSSCCAAITTSHSLQSQIPLGYSMHAAVAAVHIKPGDFNSGQSLQQSVVHSCLPDAVIALNI
ncbi:hypothetical protein AUEXF2481DRAFT_678143 [Aureobasidium subglaciale EXF-2481]|uniref:Uncharacterized protein n=1 Tax=Aureobasidium subglaciale (strain EXF-2481) TaxID=1043005 RepID=A0A074YHV8_AURSE|nr:uncharacterized protein AUEXF2481DRAFT_678143 [Aureobasidium subglaciale EXF-2481]KEQ95629.1 hypothetical protein AUEXF2481DRAFT_678143 [Aureobasidium subglaciale EXF-2481]